MITYKDLFQLAQDKGYKTFFDWNEVPVINLAELFELTLIQKWLRDKHKIDIYVSNDEGIYKAGEKSYGYTIDEKHYKSGFNSYEDALLNGINEALTIL